MEYKIIQGRDVEHLEEQVNIALEREGFKPLGGVCGYENTHGYLLQAVVKEK